MKFKILFLFFGTFLFNAQKIDYKQLKSDKFDGKWYYAFDHDTADGFYSWLKLEDTVEKNPSIESTEFYIEYKCSDKKMSTEIITINWRDAKPESMRKKEPFMPIPENHISMALLKKYCN